MHLPPQSGPSPASDHTAANRKERLQAAQGPAGSPGSHSTDTPMLLAGDKVQSSNVSQSPGDQELLGRVEEFHPRIENRCIPGALCYEGFFFFKSIRFSSFFFFPLVLLRHNGHVTLYQFKACNNDAMKVRTEKWS